MSILAHRTAVNQLFPSLRREDARVIPEGTEINWRSLIKYKKFVVRGHDKIDIIDEERYPNDRQTLAGIAINETYGAKMVADLRLRPGWVVIPGVFEVTTRILWSPENIPPNHPGILPIARKILEDCQRAAG